MEKNRKLARFLGWELSSRGGKFKTTLPPLGYVKINPKYLYFNQSMDWLLPVVDKIFQLAHDDMTIREKLLNQKNNAITLFDNRELIEGDIEKVFLSAVEFVESYNLSH